MLVVGEATTVDVVDVDVGEKAIATTARVKEEVMVASMEVVEATKDTMHTATTNISSTKNAVSCISSNQRSN